MAGELDTISAKDGDFYAEYHHEAQRLRVVINTPRGPLAEVSKVDIDVWLELKSCADPMQTYLRFYRPKPAREEEPRTHRSPAAKKPTPEQAAAARRREEANRPMGCGMKMFLLWLGACGLVLFASLVSAAFRR